MTVARDLGLPFQPGARHVPYTLWSRDRLLGHTDLGYLEVFPRHRMGDFHPTELGEKLMPILTGVSEAHLELSKSTRERWRDADPDAAPDFERRHEELRSTSEYADVAAAEAHYDALELTLRGPDGSIIPTDWISVRDTESLLALAEESMARLDDLDDIDPILASDEERRLLESVEHDSEIIEQLFDDNAADAMDAGTQGPYDWEEHSFPRFQIQVGLLGVDDQSLDGSGVDG